MRGWTPLLVAGAALVGALVPVRPASNAQGRPGMSCLFTNVADLAFGAYDSLLSAPLDGTGYIAFRCDSVGAFDSVRIELERGGGRAFSPRYMSQRGDRLAYDIYIDAARTIVWGDGSRGSARYETRPPNGIEVTVPLYGRVRPRQAIPPGQYSDRIRVTIHY